MTVDDESGRLRELPGVDALAASLDGVSAPDAVRAARAAVQAERARLEADPGATLDKGALIATARCHAAAAARPSLRRVLNATGVIVHTNLGRAPLAAVAARAVAAAAEGYANLEHDSETGARGSRQAHVEGLLRELTGAEAALVVNNGAAAVLLAAAALAAGREAIVSRGQLVEIGGSFRVPDVIAQSGARLVEVGTTNRTRIGDYERSLGEATGVLLRVHASNFRTLGFVEEVEIEALCELGERAGVPVVDDAGSGALATGIPELAGEPALPRSVAAGCAVVCCSGDKLLGGPQAGLMVGRADAIERCARHPLARALRIDKLSLAALEATLRLYADPARARAEVPVLAMLTAPPGDLRARAEAMATTISTAGHRAEALDASARVGGGALPLLELEGPVCAIDSSPLAVDDLAARLRGGEPPVIGRVRRGRLLLDPRTLSDEDARAAAEATVAALGAP